MHCVGLLPDHPDLPIQAEASAAVVGGIVSAAGVSVSAPVAIAASMIALGVMAKNTNPLVFESMVNDAVASLTAAGKWVKAGTAELLQTIDEAGTKSYYVVGDMLEDVRSFLFQESYVTATPPLSVYEYTYNTKTYTFDYPVSFVLHYVYTGSSGQFTGLNYKLFAVSTYPFSYSSGSRSYRSVEGNGFYYCTLSSTSGGTLPSLAGVQYVFYGHLNTVSGSAYSTDGPYGVPTDDIISSTYDLTLGHIPYAGAFTDGSSALEWAEEYARKALKVIEGGNDPDPDSQPPNDGKWFWPLALGLTVGVLGSMSQADEWSGQTPQEFNDYSTKTEFEILNRPEFDGWQGLEIAPATNPES